MTICLKERDGCRMTKSWNQYVAAQRIFLVVSPPSLANAAQCLGDALIARRIDEQRWYVLEAAAHIVALIEKLPQSMEKNVREYSDASQHLWRAMELISIVAQRGLWAKDEAASDLRNIEAELRAWWNVTEDKTI